MSATDTYRRALIIFHACMYAWLALALFYWRDLVSVWGFSSSVGWMGFTLAIVLLLFLYIYRKRKALKSLALVSESRGWWGTASLVLALTLYLLGSYLNYTLWFHLASLVLFTIAYLTIMLDFRIAKVLAMPLLALLFIAPTIAEELVWNIFLALTFLVIVVLFASDFKVSKRLRSVFARIRGGAQDVGEEEETCPACELEVMREEPFCLHCGRGLGKLRPGLSVKCLVAKFLLFLAVVCVLTFGYLPVFSVTAQGPRVSSYSFYGVEQHQLLDPSGWLLNSSERLSDYERRHGEDYAVLNDYVSQKFGGNRLTVLLEVCSETPFLMDDWQVSGWLREEVEDVPLGESVVGHYVVLWEPIRNKTLPVLYWSMILLFNVDSGYSVRTVGVSINMRFDGMLSEPQIFELLDELKGIARSIIDRWFVIDRLTRHVSTLSQIYARFRDPLFTVLSVAGVFLLAGWIRAGDDKMNRLTEQALLLSDEEAGLLLAASKMKRRRFKGRELWEEYRRMIRKQVDISQFYRRLWRFLTLGLLGRDYMMDEDDELRMVWVRNLP